MYGNVIIDARVARVARHKQIILLIYFSTNRSICFIIGQWVDIPNLFFTLHTLTFRLICQQTLLFSKSKFYQMSHIR